MSDPIKFRIITSDTCPWCDKAKAEITKRGGTFESLSYNQEPWIKDLIIKAGFTTVPQIWTIDGEHIGGYEKLVAWFERKDQQDNDL